MTKLINSVVGAVLAAAVQLLLGTPHSLAIYIRDDVAVAQYNNLAAQRQYQAVGYLGFAGAAFSFCAGTLVSPTAFLTAAHCLFDPISFNPRPANTLNVGFGANFPAGGLGANNVASYTIDPQFLLCSACGRYDVAVLELSAPVNNITPALVYLGDAVGYVGTIVGYGLQNDGNGNPLVGANNELAANNMIDGFGNFGFLQNLTYETDFDNPAGTTNTFGAAQPLPLEGNPCPGDSGGPLFANVAGNEILAGALSLRGANAFDPDPSHLCNYGSVAQYSYLADPITVAYLEDLNLGIGFVLVPEPSSLALPLVFFGLSGLALVRWRTSSSHYRHQAGPNTSGQITRHPD